MQRGIKIVESNLVWLHRLMDAVLPICILYFSTLLYSVHWHDRYIIMGTLGGMLFILSSQASGTYRNWHGLSFFSSIKTILKSWLWTWAVLIIIAFLYKDTQNFSRFVIALWALLTPFTLIIYRLLLRAILIRYRKHSSRSRNIAIAGAGKVGQHMANIIKSNEWLGFNIVAFLMITPNLLAVKSMRFLLLAQPMKS